MLEYLHFMQNKIKEIFFRIKRKIHHLTIKKVEDFFALKWKDYDGIKLTTNHYRIRYRNYYGKTKEPDLIEFINRLNPEDTMWDVGANIGYFSLYAAKKRGVNVLAFEPDQMTTNIINKNIYLNNLSEKVLNIPVALNDETKISSFNMREFMPANAYNTFDRNKNLWGKNFAPDFIQGAIGFRADDLILDNQLIKFANPNFIKIDVDGNELKVLGGMKNTLKRAEHLCIELSPKHPEFELIQKLLKEIDFHEIEDNELIDDKRAEAGMRNFYFENQSLK